MSKQLGISATASLFAMVAFVLVATPSYSDHARVAANETGATIEIASPVFDR
ncbi:hypothetical protein [Aurantiacibacter sediminis]|uniref:Uncharacterized protein n=1 Tax=Aurantiacibacter sediminis TaxID=2793064 RepID=A0ABS0N1T4_9SPHN|nr:hypothetical protein [Aurantiacibacter sediminis]MBH5321916.1 hypothetical protein [Aurantiacibacter sediminis]